MVKVILLTCAFLSFVSLTVAIKHLKPIVEEPTHDHENVPSTSEIAELSKKLVPKLDSKPVGKIKPVATAGKIGIKTLASSNQRGLYPWQAAINVEGTNFCSGSLIHGQWVLTAAHCAHNRKSFLITLGHHNTGVFEAGRIYVETTTKFVHSLFSLETLTNDIALIMLPIIVPTNTAYINVIRMPKISDATKTIAGTNATHTGYTVNGTENGIAPTQNLTAISMKILQTSTCALVYGTTYVTSATLCANTTSVKSCIGDSGGPLIHREIDGLWTQIGIHSIGSSETCLKGQPSTYIRTASYLGWISTTTGLSMRV